MTQRMELKEAEIVQSRWQTRRDGYAGESFEGLVSSIKRHGIINPLGVFVNENNEFELVYGHRRLMAARKAGRKTIPVDVIGSLSTGEVQVQLDKFQEMVLVDNLFHEDLTAVEVARGLQDLIDQQGLTQEQAAKVIGKSQQWVSDKLALLKCGPEVQKALTARAVEETVAKKLATLPEDVQGAVLERVKGHTSREAGPIIEEIKEALEPGFWDLPEDKPWSPVQINIKAIIDHCLEQVAPDKMGEMLGNLRVSGNLKPPDQQANYFMSYFSKACGLGGQTLEDWQVENGRGCETCLFAGEELWRDCGEPETKTCTHCLIAIDPVRLPYPDSEGRCAECVKEGHWCTDISCYIMALKSRRAVIEQEAQEEDLEETVAMLEGLRAFYDRQLSEDVDCGHWLAQACEHCLSFRGPDQREQCGLEEAKYVATAFWQSEEIVVPRCSAFRVKDASRIPEIGQGCFDEILLDWLGRVVGDGVMGDWLPGESGKARMEYLRSGALNRKQLAALLTYVRNPVLTDWHPSDELMNPITGEKSTWKILEETEEATTPESG